VPARQPELDRILAVNESRSTHERLTLIRVCGGLDVEAAIDGD
jgi:hypothetical protein